MDGRSTMSRFHRTHHSYILLGATLVLLLLPITGMQIGFAQTSQTGLPLVEPALHSMMQENPDTPLSIIVQFEGDYTSTNVHELLGKGLHSTKREVYYTDVNLFKQHILTWHC